MTFAAPRKGSVATVLGAPPRAKDSRLRGVDTPRCRKSQKVAMTSASRPVVPRPVGCAQSPEP
jgi:hypothetical protein